MTRTARALPFVLGMLFAGTALAALDAKGKKLWDEEGKDGALTNGSMRGVRFANQFGYRYGAGISWRWSATGST